MVTPYKIYIISGNPFVYEAYDNFCEKLNYKFETIIVEYCQNPEDHFHHLDSFFSNESQLEKTILFAHSYGSYHAIKLYEKYNFHSCYLLGPFLMKPSENIYEYVQTEGVLELFSVALFRPIILMIYYIIILLTPNFVFNYMIGVNKSAIPKNRALSILKTIKWEKEEISSINNLDYLKDLKKLKDIQLLRPIKDLWSNYKIYEYWNPKNRRLLDIQHSFCLNEKDCKIVSQTIFDDIVSYNDRSKL